VKPQLEIIREICPEAKVLGAVYNPGDESNTKTVNEMKRLVPEFGLQYIEAGVSTTGDVRNAGMSLVGRADIVWFPLCNTTAAGLEALVSVCEEHKMPLFPPDYDSVKRGGIAAIYYSNEELGQLGAEHAAKILAGEDPCKLPVTTFTQIRIYLNPDAAERMGATIPQSLRDRAFEIVQ
jgi:putative ABC transport system substrate-binding protein